MPPEIDTLATFIGALIKTLVKNGALTSDEARGILAEAEKVLKPDPHISFRATARQAIERVRTISLD